MTSAGGPVRLGIVVSAAAFGSADSDLTAYRDAVVGASATFLADLGIGAEIDVNVSSDASGESLCRIVLGDRELVISARRRMLVASGVAGDRCPVLQPGDTDELLAEMAAALPPQERAALIVGLVQASVVANLATVVAACAGMSAANSSDDGGRDSLRSATRLARFGIAPARMAEAQASVGSTADGALPSARIEAFDFGDQVTVEMAEPTLRWVTESPNLSRRWDESPGGALTGFSTTVGVSSALWTMYGVDLGPIRLGIDPSIPVDRFRIRFGEITTSAHALLPVDVVALRGQPGWLDGGDILRWTLDPIGGEWWPVVSEQWRWQAAEEGIPFLDTVAMITRTLFAEIQMRLARWPAHRTAERWLGGLADPLRTQLAEAMPGVVRSLLCDGVCVGQPAPVIEGMMRGLVSADPSEAGLVNATRKVLGPAVVGLTPPEYVVERLTLDSAALDQAIGTDSVQPLLAAHPELLSTTVTHLVVCPESHRAAVAEMLRPLLDVARVVTAEEIADAALNLPSPVPA